MDGQTRVVEWFNDIVACADLYLHELESVRSYFTTKKTEADTKWTRTNQALDTALQDSVTLADQGLIWFTGREAELSRWLTVHPKAGKPSLLQLSATSFSELRRIYDDGDRAQQSLTNTKGLWRLGCKRDFLEALQRKHSALQAAKTVCGQLKEQAQRQHDKLRDQNNDEHSNRVVSLTATLRQNEASALEKYKRSVLAGANPSVLQPALSATMKEVQRVRRSFSPATNVPTNVAVGFTFCDFGFLRSEQSAYSFMAQTYVNARVPGVDGAVAQPFLLNLSDGFSLFFRYRESDFAKAMGHVQNICLSSFLSMPPGKLMFHFVDSSNAAQTFALFKNFEDTQGGYSIIEGGIQVTEDGISRQLQIVVDYIRDMNVNTFRGVYPNIREYNRRNPAFPKPYYILGIMGYPAGFTAQAKKLLAQIIAGGRQCGVYVVVMADQDKIENTGTYNQTEEAAVMKGCTCFDFRDGFYWQASAPRGVLPSHDIRFTVHTPPDIGTVVKIAPGMKQDIFKAGRLLVKFSQIAPPQARMFQARADDGFSIPIGMTGASEIMHLDVGQPNSEAHHMLVCGATGSGKSRLLHALIVNALLTYNPSDLDISLVDFKQGTEFKVFSDYVLPVFRMIAIEAKPEFGAQALKDIMDEVQRRGTLFRNVTTALGSSVVNLKDYNAAVPSGDRLPRMLVILDEFHVLFSGGNKKAASDAESALGYLLTNGRNFGVHIILSTQSMNGVTGISANAMAQIGVRVALKCAEEDAAIVLGPVKEAIRQIAPKDPGSAIIIPNYTKAQEFYKMRAALLQTGDEQQILKRIEQEYQRLGVNTQAAVRKTRVLVSRVEDSRGNPFQAFVQDGRLESSPFVIHPGEALDMRPAFDIHFKPDQSNENLLIAGENIDKQGSLLYFSLLDLAIAKLRLKQSGATGCLDILFFDVDSGPDNSPLRILAKSAPNLIQRVEPQQALATLTALHSTLSNHPARTVTWAVFANLNYMDMLSAGAYASSANGFRMLEEILRDGPAQMIHTAALTDDLSVFANLYPNLLSYFAKRVAFDLLDVDAKAFARTEAATIKDDAAALVALGAKTELFRPYLLPGVAWQKKLYERFKSLA